MTHTSGLRVVNEDFWKNLIVTDYSKLRGAEKSMFDSLQDLLPKLKADDLLMQEILRSYVLSKTKEQEQFNRVKPIMTRKIKLTSGPVVKAAVESHTIPGNRAGIFKSVTMLRCLRCNRPPIDNIGNFE